MILLTNSWQKVRFDQICKNISNRIDDPKQAKTDYYIGLEHLDSEEPKILRHGSTQDVVSAKSYFKKGQILFGRRRVYLKKLAIANRDGICSTDIYVMEPKSEKIINEFLSIFMQSEEFYERTIKLSAGSLSPRVKWSQLSEQEFLIPSIPEQETILSLTHQIDDSISKTQDLLEKTKIYSISRRELLLTRGIGHTKFKKVPWRYGKTIEIPEEWDIQPLNDKIKILSGFAFSSKFFDQKKGLPLIRIRDLPNNSTEIFYNGTYSNEYLIQKGDLLVGMDGEFRPYIWQGEKSLLNQRVSKLTSKANDKLDQLFLYYRIRKELEYYELVNIGTTVGHISKHDIEKISIPLPPLPEQKQIASILSELNDQITQQQFHLTNLKTMRKSILNSKLTPKMEEMIVL